MSKGSSARKRQAWLKPLVVAIIAVIVVALAVLGAKAFVNSSVGTDFVRAYPGASERTTQTPVGLPVWLGWQHFLNAFFLVCIVRSGWLIRTTARPQAYWVRKNQGALRTKAKPVKISINHWFHISVNTVWILNGLVFYMLLIATGQWRRIVPTDWGVFPNAVSAGIQYLSLQWPTEDPWVNYNGLQLLSYFVTVFVAAPLAIVTGLRMTPGLGRRFKAVERYFPLSWARRMHFPVMIYFVGFVVVHVVLVLATGALRNLNAMYAARSSADWLGFGIFAGATVLMVAAWFLTKPLLYRSVAELSGKVTRS